MTAFNPRLAWKEASDVRHETVGELAKLLFENRPVGIVWPIVAARRVGKTWALKGLEYHALKMGKDAKYFDLRCDQDEFQAATSRFLLIDEPSLEGKDASDNAIRLIAQLRKMQSENKRVVLALSPAEWSNLCDADGTGALICIADMQSIDPLTVSQVENLVLSRATWAPDLLQQIESGARCLWKRTPFLLEFLFSEAEQRKFDVATGEIEGLLHGALASINAEFEYTDLVFKKGLTARQRSLLRDVARNMPVSAPDCIFLKKCGLIDYDAATNAAELVDPLLRIHLPPPLRIHHVSDLHVGPKGDVTGRAGDDPASSQMGEVIGFTDVINDYCAYVQSLQLRPHLLVVSGDIVEYGKASQYNLVKNWFQEMAALMAEHPLIESTASRVLVVAGNHDVNRDLVDAANVQERHLPFADAFRDYPRTRLEEPPAARNLETVRYEKAKLEIVLLGSAELGQSIDIDKPLTDLLDRAAVLGLSETERAAVLHQTERRIDPGIVHHADLQRLRSLPPPRCEMIRLAVVHHHVSPMPHYADVSRFAGLINAGQVKDACLASQVSLILHGHMHNNWFASESWPGFHKDWTIRIAAAATLGSVELGERGFNEIQILREGDECELEVTQYQREGPTWAPKRAMRFRPGLPVERSTANQ